MKYDKIVDDNYSSAPSNRLTQPYALTGTYKNESLHQTNR